MRYIDLNTCLNAITDKSNAIQYEYDAFTNNRKVIYNIIRSISWFIVDLPLLILFIIGIEKLSRLSIFVIWIASIVFRGLIKYIVQVAEKGYTNEREIAKMNMSAHELMDCAEFGTLSKDARENTFRFVTHELLKTSNDFTTEGE